MVSCTLRSSVLDGAAYYPSTNVLDLYFCDGKIYRYTFVPITIYMGIKNAVSPGSYYNRVIKGNFVAYRIA